MELVVVEGPVVVLVSGGVDSSLTAHLVKESGLTASYWFIDNGLQRKGEASKLRGMFSRIGIKVNVLNGRRDFLKVIKNCETGEEKRDAIGEALVKKAMDIADIEGSKNLVFGTIKNDLLVCENCSVTDLGRYKLVEPLRDMLKEDVIRLAKGYGLREFAKRQHFPGVGFAVRIEGKVTLQKLKLIGEITDFVEGVVQNFEADYYAYFPILLKTGNVLLRIVESDQGLEAKVGKLNQEQMNNLAGGIMKRFPVNRVFLDLTPKPLNYIEYM